MVQQKADKFWQADDLIHRCLDSPPVTDPLCASAGVICEGGGGWWWRVRGRRTHWSHLLPCCWDEELLPPARPGLLQGQNRIIRNVLESSIDPSIHHLLPILPKRRKDFGFRGYLMDRDQDNRVHANEESMLGSVFLPEQLHQASQVKAVWEGPELPWEPNTLLAGWGYLHKKNNKKNFYQTSCYFCISKRTWLD